MFGLIIFPVGWGQIQLVPPSSFVKTEAALAYGSEVRMESESRLIPNRSAFR